MKQRLQRTQNECLYKIIKSFSSGASVINSFLSSKCTGKIFDYGRHGGRCHVQPTDGDVALYGFNNASRL